MALLLARLPSFCRKREKGNRRELATPGLMLQSLSPAENEESVKKIILAALLLLSAHAWAGGNPDPAQYTINVHVSSSQIDIERGYQVLNVVINGKKYELGSELRISKLLALGDYKAKLVKDEHSNTYDSFRVYEFLLPEKTRQYAVIGQSE